MRPNGKRRLRSTAISLEDGHRVSLMEGQGTQLVLFGAWDRLLETYWDDPDGHARPARSAARDRNARDRFGTMIDAGRPHGGIDFFDAGPASAAVGTGDIPREKRKGNRGKGKGKGGRRR